MEVEPESRAEPLERVLAQEPLTWDSEMVVIVSRKDHDARKLPKGDFRRERAYLADHLFALSSGKSPDPTDKVPRGAWRRLMQLPTDVVLRTTDYQGSFVADCVRQSAAWINASPLGPDQSSVMSIPAMDAWDEFEAANFVASHGWYRQGRSCLRLALEVVAQGAGYAAKGADDDYRKWRDRGGQPDWSKSIGRLKDSGPPDVMNQVWPILDRLYGDLCKTVHGAVGHSNSELWESNGPIWAPKAFVLFWLDYCDTLAACYVLLKLGWRDMGLPKRARVLFEAPSKRWDKCGDTLLREFFAG